MSIIEKIEFLRRYVSQTQFPNKVKMLLKDEGFFIASECARRLNFSKQYFSENPEKHATERVQFQNRKYYKL